MSTIKKQIEKSSFEAYCIWTVRTYPVQMVAPPFLPQHSVKTVSILATILIIDNEHSFANFCQHK